jgi:hypothetical protein
LKGLFVRSRMMGCVSKAANTVEEVCKLVDAGFDYVCDVGDAKVFRKRK